MYGKCGALERAHRVFDEMGVRDVVSYNALLGTHARGGEDMVNARDLFNGMPERNLTSWNAMIVGYVSIHRVLFLIGCQRKMLFLGLECWWGMLKMGLFILLMLFVGQR
jgi:hypothetical protein